MRVQSSLTIVAAYIMLHVYNSFCGMFFFLYMVNSPYSVLSGRQCGAG